MEAKKLHDINVTMKIIELKLVDFNVLNNLPPRYAELGIEKDKIQFEFKMGIQLDKSKKRIHIDLKTNFYADLEKNTHLGNLNSTGDFEVLNLDEILIELKGKIPNFLFANLIGVLLSTSRGFLILKSVGTVMEGIIMPMINPNIFFPKTPDIKSTTD